MEFILCLNLIQFNWATHCFSSLLQRLPLVSSFKRSCKKYKNTASLMPAPYIPDIRLENCGRYYLYEIGFLTVAGGFSMTWFQWKLNLWIWCSGVWPMNCFGRNRCHFGCVTVEWSGSGLEIWDHSDYGRSNELINFLPEWSHHPLLAQIGELARRLLIYLDPSDLRPLILIQIISKEPTLNLHDTRDQQT